MEKPKKGNNPRSFEELLRQQCPFHLGNRHSDAECRQLNKECGLTPKADKGKTKDKADDNQDNEDKGGNF
jgi:hypothetical protein